MAGLLPAGIGQIAQAHPYPTPPPSGIVIHLFGPDSITSNILPEAKPAAPAGAMGASQGAPVDSAAVSSPASAAPASASGSDSPGVGQILHQMFVVGNPEQAPGAALSPGRPTSVPSGN